MSDKGNDEEIEEYTLILPEDKPEEKPPEKPPEKPKKRIKKRTKIVHDESKDEEWENMENCPKCGHEIILLIPNNWKYCSGHGKHLPVVYLPED